MPCRNKADIRSVPQKVAKSTNLALSELFIRQPVGHQQRLSLKSASLWSFQLWLRHSCVWILHTRWINHFYTSLQSKICFSFLFLQLNVRASLCRMMCVQSLKLQSCFCIHCWKSERFSMFSEKTDFNEGRPRDLRHHTQFGSQSWFNIRKHKCAVGTWSLQLCPAVKLFAFVYILEL